MSKLQSAIALASKGLYVFPLHNVVKGGACSCGNLKCQSVGKHPRLGGWERKATTNTVIINAWWSEAPNANIGIACGPSNVVVLDVDIRNDGADVLANLVARHEALPDTWEAITGSGGRHFYFRATEPPVKNQAPLTDADGTKLYGVDIRGVGGLVVAPGSEHASGGWYDWEASSHPDDVPLAPLPAWLSSIARGTRRTTGSETAPRAEDIGPLIEGGRNSALTSLAGSMRRRGMSEAAILAGLLAENEERCAPPLGDAEVRYIAHSVSRYTPSLPLTVDAETGEVHDFPCTDAGNAERFIARHGADVRYVEAFGYWLLWDGMRWMHDRNGSVMARAIDTVRQIPAEAVNADEKARKDILKWAATSESLTRLSALLSIAKTDEQVTVAVEQLDASPWLLGCENGTLDLRTGTLQAAKRSDYITAHAPVAFDPAATCPTWHRFLETVQPGAEMREHLQRAAGYTLTGINREHVAFFTFGTGKNGKSTFINTILRIMGPYAAQAAPGLLAQKQNPSHSTDIAELRGRRLVVNSEMDEGARLAEGPFKQMTGGDRLKGRFLYGNNFEFEATHKLWVSTNHRPVIKGTDDGVWRRILAVPFSITIPEEERDETLADRLTDEYAGILAWMVAGCVKWQIGGLGRPSEVSESTAEYRQDMDTLAAFLDDTCELDMLHVSPKSTVYAAYQKWCETNGEFVLSQRRLSGKLTDRGFKSDRNGKDRVHTWLGVRVKDGFLSLAESF